MSICRALAAIVLLAGTARAEDADYTRQIKPVLQARCYACHGALKQKGKLRLDTAASAIRGGQEPAVTPGDVEASPLLDRISAEEDDPGRMPPEGERLKPAEVEAIRAWIAGGAKAPADEQPERDARDHWSFRTPVRPALPTVERPGWSKNPIDAFLAAKHQERGLIPQEPADKRTWLRRLSLDLVGLPPTREEQEAFLADDTDGAVDRVVTRLLDSPQYGERWGRHWMDIWRYSDWWGLGPEVRNSQKHIWHWRDWIIESLNADKGYDQMLREMLAADELYPDDLDKLRASGFLARQYFKFNRTSWLDETIEHTSKAMLGLTFNCAKCHDHKYDPFSQVEYTQMRAIFEPYQVRTDLVPGEIDPEKDGIPRAFDANPEARTFLHIRGDDRRPDEGRTIVPASPAFLTPVAATIEPVSLPAEAHQPGLRPFVEEAYRKAAERGIDAARKALDAAKAELVEAERAETAKPAETTPGPRVVETFATANPELWEIRDGLWSYADGKLIQSRTGAQRAAIRLKKQPPADFEAKLSYKPTGGEVWKSVGITLDAGDGAEVLAYLSSYAEGPKAQISFKRDGQDVYPPEAAQPRPVEIDRPHELVVRVRGTLINLVVDGQPSVAYRLPIPRRPGPIELIAFDAKAEFLAFELAELPASTILAEPATPPGKPADGPQRLELARQSVVVAEKALAAAGAQPASIAARAAAGRARHQNPVPEGASGLVAEAARLEKVALAAKADEDVSRAALELLRAAPEKKDEAGKKVEVAKAALEKARAAVVAPGESFTPLRGSWKTLESNLETEESRSKPFPETSTGRRSALARWITDPKHPLPARVAVNHLWTRHFGRALVPTVFDFGRKGTPPTHPELLDWLAVELVEHGWSMKHIHRLIVTSNAYRLTSSSAGASTQTLANDPENTFYWRANPTRMESELVRDSLLHLAGELDPTRGGPPIPVADETSKRRSLYFVHSHNEHQKFLATFDDASVLDCYRRPESIVPQQALALENSPLAASTAEKVARRLEAANPGPSEPEFIRAAFLAVLGAEPTEEEQAAVQDALGQFREASKRAGRADPAASARVGLVLALLNHNDFVTIR